MMMNLNSLQFSIFGRCAHVLVYAVFFCVSDGDLCTASAPKTSLLLATVQSVCIRLKGGC